MPPSGIVLRDVDAFAGRTVQGVQHVDHGLSAERDSVAVSFQVCQIDQVICLRHTGGQVIGPASKIVRPEDGRTFLPVILYKRLYSCG